MKFRKNPIIIYAALAIILSSCCSIIHGNKQDVSFSSQPTGAKIFIDGNESGITPKVITLARSGKMKGDSTKNKKGYKIRIELNGYQPYETMLIRKTDGWVWGNILFGGLIGLIIDAGSGSIYRLSPSEFKTTLSANTSLINKKDDNIYIAVALKVDPNWEKIGNLDKIK